MNDVPLIIKVDGFQGLRRQVAVDIEQIAMAAIKVSRSFALTQVPVPCQDVISQLEPKGIGNSCRTA